MNGPHSSENSSDTPPFNMSATGPYNSTHTGPYNSTHKGLYNMSDTGLYYSSDTGSYNQSCFTGRLEVLKHTGGLSSWGPVWGPVCDDGTFVSTDRVGGDVCRALGFHLNISISKSNGSSINQIFWRNELNCTSGITYPRTTNSNITRREEISIDCANV